MMMMMMMMMSVCVSVCVRDRDRDRDKDKDRDRQREREKERKRERELANWVLNDAWLVCLVVSATALHQRLGKELFEDGDHAPAAAEVDFFEHATAGGDGPSTASRV